MVYIIKRGAQRLMQFEVRPELRHAQVRPEVGLQVLCIQKIALVHLLLLNPCIEFLDLLVLIECLVLAALAVVECLPHFGFGLLNQAGCGRHRRPLRLDWSVPWVVLLHTRLQLVRDVVLAQLLPLLSPQPSLFVYLGLPVCL